MANQQNAPSIPTVLARTGCLRPATLKDIGDLVRMANEVYEAMHWKNHGGKAPNKNDSQETLLAMLKSPDVDLSVVDIDQGIVGACAVVIANFPWNKRIVTASEWMWHMQPSFPDGLTKRRWMIGMLDHMMTWAKKQGAHVFKICTAPQYPATTRLLERRGMKVMELACVGPLN